MFGRRRNRRQQDEPAPEEVPEAEGEQGAPVGPYDSTEAPADDRPRLDLGSLRLPVPEGAQLQVEMDRAGPVRAVHLVIPQGQLTVTAFAAPRSGGLWAEIARELAGQLRSEGSQIGLHTGEWGREITAVTPQATLRFLGVDGPRWMLRGVAAGADPQADVLAEALREVIRDTVVVRGAEPLPVRSALPIELPEALAQQLKQAAAQAQQGAAGDRPGSAPPSGAAGPDTARP